MGSTVLEVGRYTFNLFAIPPLATAFFALALGVAVTVRERGSRVSWAFFDLCLVVWVWLFTFSLLYLSSDPDTAYIWAKASYLGIPFIPPAMYHFTTRVLDIYRERRVLVWSSGVVFGAFALAFTASERLFAQLHRHPWGFYPRFESLAFLFVVPFVGLVALSLWEFWRAYRATEPGTERLRARAFLIGFGVADLALIDFLPVYGLRVYPVGFLCVFAFLSIAAYAIWRYRLADLTPGFIADRLVRTMPDMLVVCDAGGRVKLVNPAFRGGMHFDADELGGRPLEELADGRASRENLRNILRRSSTFDRELTLRAKDGEAVEVSVSASELRDENGFRVGSVLVARDIRERKRMEGELLRAALFDRLTGLPNRVLLLDRIERALAHARRRAIGFAVLYLDLDGFEIVKDTLGHSVADEVLVHVARRLVASVRETDTVCRLEGDQFALLLRYVSDSDAAIPAARRIQGALSSAFMLEGQQLFLSAGIGIALSSADYEEPEAMLRDAHAALGRAKERGRGRVEVFDREMRARAVRRLSLESDLRRALKEDRLGLLYQPIVSLETGRPWGCEALLRWRHPERGWIRPEEFLEVAEETGLILPMGTWAIRRACRQLRAWREASRRFADLRVHVNLSAREVARPGLIEQVEGALHETGLAPESLVLEITETTLMKRPERVLRTLDALRERHVRFALDDFGTGYSSLAYLHRFPVEILKIDRSFVTGDHGPGDAAIIRAVVALGESLGMEVIAEGVETEKQADLLRSLGCRHAQGYHFSRPLDPPEASADLAARLGEGMPAGGEPEADRAGA